MIVFSTLILSVFATPAFAEQHISNGFRDADGRVWGTDGTTRKFNQPEAVAYCESLGARLPLPTEFQRLTFLLGLVSIARYSPFQADGTTPVIPALRDQNYWTAEQRDGYAIGTEFLAGEGLLGATSSGRLNSVICIAD